MNYLQSGQHVPVRLGEQELLDGVLYAGEQVGVLRQLQGGPHLRQQAHNLQSHVGHAVLQNINLLLLLRGKRIIEAVWLSQSVR